MTNRQFELRVFKAKKEGFGLGLSEQPQQSEDVGNRKKQEVTRVWGLPLKVMMEVLLNTLRHQGYRPTALSPQRKEPFVLDEVSGVRLALFFLALKPLRKVSRMEEIVAALDSMTNEEAYYWYAKCTNGRNARKARKALRILLSGE